MKDIIKNSHYRIQQIIKNFTGSYNEDIEQEVYLRVIKNSDKYIEKNRFTQWVSTIAANLCRDFLKSSTFKNTQGAVRDDEVLNNIKSAQTPEKIYSQKERQKLILKEIDKLPKKMKETLILYEFEDCSYEKIASKLNISIGTVKSRINSARKILKTNLAFLLEDNEDE